VDGFRVDLDAVARLAGDLDGARGQLDGALRALGGTAARVGPAELDEACEEFRESWRHGLRRLGECTDAVRDGLDRTRAHYAAADAAVAGAVSGTGRR
jgi:uncharacterized protein YukE